jgi:hypothetical protein
LQIFSTGTLGEKKANVKLDFSFVWPSPPRFPATSNSDIYRLVPASTNPSASIIAAAIIEILCSVLAALGTAGACVIFLFAPMPASGPQLPTAAKSMMAGMMIFFFALAIFGIFTGVGLMRLKEWARITTLVWAGVTVFFSAVILLFAIFMPFPAVPNQPAESAQLARVVLASFYEIPSAIGIWWLVLFNRKAIVTQFSTRNASLAPDIAILPGEPFSSMVSVPAAKPSCPLPLAVVAGFSILSSLSLVFLLFMRMPAVIFGHAIHGPAGTGIWALSCAIYLITGIGLLLLKPWSHVLAMGMQFFWLLSGTVSLLSNNYEKILRESLASMPMTANQPYGADYFQHMRSFSLMGLMFPVLILGILIYYRPRFLEAASRAASTS